MKGTFLASKRIRLGLALLVIVAVAVAALWPKPPPQIITLSDGRQYRFAGVTWGTNHHQPGPFMARSLGYLPTNVSATLRGKLGSRFTPVPALSTDRPELLVWLEPLGTNTPRQNAFLGPGGVYWRGGGSSELTGNLLVEGGVPSGLGGVEEVYGAPPQWPALAFAEVPRRAEVLECDLWQAGILGRSAPTPGPAKIEFRNPLYGHYPQWQPETLPASKSAGDIEVHLESLSNQDSPRIPSFRANQSSEAKTWHMEMSLSVASQRWGEIWEVADYALSDATGNSFTNFQHLGRAGYGKYILTGALWPDESAWRLKLGMKRTANFPPEDLVTFSNIPISLVPGHPFATSLGAYKYSVTNYSRDGIPIVARLQTSTNRVFPTGGAAYDKPVWYIDVVNPTGPPVADWADGHSVDVVGLRSDTGEDASPDFFAESWTFSGPPGPQLVPEGAKTVTVTVSVQKRRYVEFLVKPPFH